MVGGQLAAQRSGREASRPGKKREGLGRVDTVADGSASTRCCCTLDISYVDVLCRCSGKSRLDSPSRKPFKACVCAGIWLAEEKKKHSPLPPFPLAKVQPAFESFDFGTKQGTCRRHLRCGSCAPDGMIVSCWPACPVLSCLPACQPACKTGQIFPEQAMLRRTVPRPGFFGVFSLSLCFALPCFLHFLFLSWRTRRRG